MYYSYKIIMKLEKTIDISEQLDKINAKDLPKKGEDLEEFDADFDKEYNNVKEDFN